MNHSVHLSEDFMIFSHIREMEVILRTRTIKGIQQVATINKQVNQIHSSIRVLRASKIKNSVMYFSCFLKRHAVGRQGQILLDLKSSAFDPKEEVWTKFPPKGLKHTRPHNSCDFKWKDYCPKVFRHSVSCSRLTQLIICCPSVELMLFVSSHPLASVEASFT